MAAGDGAVAAASRIGRGRPPKLLRRDGEHQPVSVKALAHALPPEAWRDIAWREGSADWLCSRFARVRLRPAHRDTWRAEPHPEEWLLIEWPSEELEPTKYWLSTLPEDIGFDRLVDLAKLRWRIERDIRNWALPITRGAAGVASTITPHSVSLLTAS